MASFYVHKMVEIHHKKKVSYIINIYLKFSINFIIISKILDFFKNEFDVGTSYGFKVEIIIILKKKLGIAFSFLKFFFKFLVKLLLLSFFLVFNFFFKKLTKL